MGKNSTSFTKETAPKGKGAAKHIKTRIKERIGLDGWERLCDYIKTAGADKLTDELSDLDGKDFINSFTTLAEFVVPKLQRTTIEGDPDKPLVTSNLDSLSFEQLMQLKYGKDYDKK